MVQAAQTINTDDLTVGLRVRLMAMETTKSKWSTTLVGAKFGRYLIFETPRVNGIPVVFDEGSRWSVNFIARGHVYLFDGEVLGVINRPTSLLFFSYPNKADISNLRTDKRYPVRIQATIKAMTNDSDVLARVLVLDLSSGGCLTVSSTEIPESGPMKMNLYLEGVEGEDASIEGVLIEKKTSTRSQHGTFFTGFSFPSTNSTTVFDKLVAIISNLENTPLRF
jgi:c-di-GMP-binding flagellar brake protein YcgR